jgi:excisionase family DNA binding protein
VPCAACADGGAVALALFLFLPMPKAPVTPALLATGSLSLAEVAELMSTPPEMVRRWCVVGLLPGARQTMEGWRIPARSLSFFCLRRLEPHYSIKTAAAYLGLSEPTLRSWVADGSLSVRKIGTARSASVLIPESELMRRVGA